MADRLGVVINEKDQSKSVSAVREGAVGIAVYSAQGRTDIAVRCEDEDTIRRNFAQPPASMVVAGGTNYCYGLHNAFAMVRAGAPVYVKRAIPTSVVPVLATVCLQHDGTNTDAHSVNVTARGHGVHYNGLSLVVAGIERVERQITLVSGTAVSLEENALPATLKIVSAAQTDYDGPSGTGGVIFGAATALITALTVPGNITVTYENALNSNKTTLTAVNGCVVTVTYERTTTDHVVRVYIVDDGEDDPKNNYYETWLVSLKEAGKDESGSGVFIEDVLNEEVGGSEIVSVQNGSAYIESSLPIGTDPYSAVAYSNARALAAGTDGTYAASDADIKVAYQVFNNKTKYDLLKLIDAAYDDTVKRELGVIAAARKFPVAYIDPPKDTFIESGNKLKASLIEATVAQSLCNWRMGIGDKEFCIISGSTWGRITDEFNGGRKLWVPPSYVVAARAIDVHDSKGPWESVMGPRRGVTDFEKLAINLYDQKDTLNAKQVNPLIIDEKGAQMYYGNKTCKLVASAMQQAHARVTRGYMSRDMYFSALDYIAEGNVPTTWNELRDEFDYYLSEKYAAALEDYSLVVGPPKTTSSDINNQIMRIAVGLIFNQIAEEIEITTTVMRNGEDLSVAVV